MARRQLTVTIADDNRDKGKVFRITELPVIKAEEWALKALLVLGRSGVDLTPEALAGGFLTIGAMGLRALYGMNFVDAKPILDEMLDCIEILPDPNNRTVARKLVDGDIEEVATLFRLRREVLELHLGFKQGGGNSQPSPKSK